MCRVAMISVHGCPLARLGTREAGGLQMYVRALSEELGRQGMAVDVFTRRTDPTVPEIVPFGKNARVIHLNAGPVGPTDKNEVFDSLSEFVCNLQRFRTRENLSYQYIHSHYWLSGWVGNLLARRWDIPHVSMFHTLGVVKNRALADDAESQRRIEVETKVASAADRIIASSEHERQALVELYGATRERISVVPCGVDLRRFQPIDPSTAREHLGLNGDEVILFVGRMDPIKGLDLLLQSFALLKDRPRRRLVIVGGTTRDGDMKASLELAAELGLDGRVEFRGARPQSELPDYYSAADVCVIPSRYESFGLVAIEALACGTPVIASKVGGLPTVIRDGENGLLVPQRCPETFADTISSLLDDDALRERLSENARASVTRFGWEIIGKRIINLYRSVSTERRPAVACACDG